MPSAREMRLRIRSVKDLSQVTRALKTVSASKVRKAVTANAASLPYSQKAWQVLIDLAKQPGHTSLHPLLCDRKKIDRVMVIMVSSDKGLAGSYNMNVLRNTLEYFDTFEQPVDYICIGKKGRDLLLRRKIRVIADFSELNDPVSFLDISPISRLVVDEFLSGIYDQVYVSFTRFKSMTRQDPEIRKLLPLEVYHRDGSDEQQRTSASSVFTYEPDQKQILDEIIPRFTGIQIFQATLSSQASEHAARTLAMANATDNANELVGVLQLEYNKMRQQTITNDILDIVGGAAAHSN
ncbi:MAG TPA: ATP synthase F1 subunit gamma [Anaerolineaceae bacterium]|nr:ATP synthase F1 subunit gamma [Anaerolineaceae bacterium]